MNAYRAVKTFGRRYLIYFYDSVFISTPLIRSHALAVAKALGRADRATKRRAKSMSRTLALKRIAERESNTKFG